MFDLIGFYCSCLCILYHMISSHQVAGSITVKASIMRDLSWPYFLILYGPITSTDMGGLLLFRGFFFIF